MPNADAPDESAPNDHAETGSNPCNASRRQVLRLGSGGALALFIGVGAGWFDRSRNAASKPGSRTPGPATGTTAGATTTSSTTSTTTTAAPTTVSGIGEVDPRIISVGQRVIEVTGEDDLAELLAQLPPVDPGGGSRIDPLEHAAIRVGEDFERSDTITVDGWVLAASEARAAAVIALVCSESSRSTC